MLKIKSVLAACAATPLFFGAFQLAVHAQGTTFAPSKGTAGSVSGGGTNGSNGTVISNPSPPVLTPAITNAINNASAAAALVIPTLPATIISVVNGPSLSSGSIGSMVSAVVSATSPTNSTAIAALPASGGSITIPGGGSLVVGAVSVGTLSTSTPITITSANGQPITLTVTVPAGATPAQTAAAISTAAAVIAAGGTPAQAQIAGAIVGAGASPGRSIALVSALSRLTAGGPNASLPSQTLVSSLKTKSLESDNKLLLAQSDEPKLDLVALDQAITAYNGIIDESDAKTLQGLTKDKEFQKINASLKNLRALFAD